MRFLNKSIVEMDNELAGVQLGTGENSIATTGVFCSPNGNRDTFAETFTRCLERVNKKYDTIVGLD